MVESVHAEELRKRGFKFLAFGPKPQFAFFSAAGFFTFATDEVGGRWMGGANIDLSDLEFRDNSKILKAIVEAMDSTQKPH